MAERFPKFAASLRNSEVLRYGMVYAELSFEEALVIALQTDYADWKGRKDFLEGLKPKK